MKYVDLIQSIPYPKEKYIGITSDLKNRLKVHREGGSPHTSKFKQWKVAVYMAFSSEEKPGNSSNTLIRARGGPSPSANSGLEGDEPETPTFEKFLKSPFGRAFVKKRL